MSSASTGIEWSLEYRKISELRDYSRNARRLTKDQAAQLEISLSKFGLIDKPIINLDNTIIGGHQRLRILRKMGHKDVEVHVPSRLLSPQEVAELNIRHNRNTGEWDFDILANEWDAADLTEFGFDAAELGMDDIDPKAESSLDEASLLDEGKICPECGHKIKRRSTHA